MVPKFELTIFSGQRFHENMRVKTDLYVTVPEDADEGDLVFRWKLFSCALEVLPDREDHGSESTHNLDERKDANILCRCEDRGLNHS